MERFLHLQRRNNKRNTRQEVLRPETEESGEIRTHTGPHPQVQTQKKGRIEMAG